MKTVKRTWVNKKTGELVEKEYVYNRSYGGKRNKKSLTVVGKRGIYKDRLQAIVQQFKDAEDYETAYDVGAIAEQLASDVARGKIKRITVKSLISRAQKSKIAKMFINAGISVDEAAYEAEVTVEQLLDEKKWKGTIFTTPAGVLWGFDIKEAFKYAADVVWRRL